MKKLCLLIGCLSLITLSILSGRGYGDDLEVGPPARGGGGTIASSPTDTISITIANVNQAPVFFATTTAYTMNAGNTLSFSAQAQDDDADTGDTVRISIQSAPAWVSEIGNNGWLNPTQITLLAAPTTAGSASVVLVATDNHAATAAITINITVNPPACTAPTTVDDNYEVVENGTLIAEVSVLNNDTNPAPPSTVAVETPPSHGTLLNFYFDGTFTYRPNSSYVGSDSFTYRLTNNCGAYDIGTVNITVSAPVCTAPVISGLPDIPTNEDVALNNAIDLYAYASDAESPDSDLTFSIVGNTNTNVGVTIDSNRFIDINPTANWSGYSDVTIRVTDPAPCGLYSEDTFRITVTQTCDDAPIAADNSYSTNEDTPLTVAAPGVLGNDTNRESGTTLTAVPVTPVGQGSVTLNPDGSFTYTPSANWSGSTSFTYKARSSGSVCGTPIDSAPATVNITVIEQAACVSSPGDVRLYIGGTNPHVNNPFPSIQAAINAASNGDRIEVDPGQYIETINFNGKAIIVKSTSGAATTIIDACDSGSVVSFISGEDENSILEGFTITGGKGFWAGNRPEDWQNQKAGGVTITHNSTPIIRDSIITNNISSPGVGGGIYVHDSLLTLESSTVSNNLGEYGGGGIFTTGTVFGAPAHAIKDSIISGNATTSSHPGGGIFSFVPLAIENSIISNNSAPRGYGGGLMIETGDVPTTISNSVFFGNSVGGLQPWGAAIDFDFTDVIIINSTIVDNLSTNPGNNNNAINFYDGNLDIVNCIIRNNDLIKEIHTVQSGLEANVTYSNIRGGHAGNGNINSNPLFVNAGGGDFRLGAGSSCIDAANGSAAPALDIVGNSRVDDPAVLPNGANYADMGAYERQP